jgi:hypothetical protein
VQSSTSAAMKQHATAMKQHASYVVARGERPQASRTRASLIDTRLVRSELARLRGPQPATDVYRARVVRSTVSA